MPAPRVQPINANTSGRRLAASITARGGSLGITAGAQGLVRGILESRRREERLQERRAQHDLAEARLRQQDRRLDLTEQRMQNENLAASVTLLDKMAAPLRDEIERAEVIAFQSGQDPAQAAPEQRARLQSIKQQQRHATGQLVQRFRGQAPVATKAPT